MNRKVTNTVLCLAMVIAGTALAQSDSDPDGIGIYFDDCATNNCLTGAPGPLQAYVIITNPSSMNQGVGGWEAKIWLTGPAIITNITFEGSSLNFLSPPEYLVGIQIPLYGTVCPTAVKVATFDFQLLDTTAPVNWWIDAIYRHSLPEPVPAYLDGDDYNIIIPLQQSTGGPGIPVATVNGECAVPVTGATWGEAKSLFR